MGGSASREELPTPPPLLGAFAAPTLDPHPPTQGQRIAIYGSDISAGVGVDRCHPARRLWRFAVDTWRAAAHTCGGVFGVAGGSC